MSASQSSMVILAVWVLFLIAMCVKAAVDPKFAARLRANRERANRRDGPFNLRKLSNLVLWMSGALAILIINNNIKRLAADWHLSSAQETGAFFASVFAIAVSGYFVNRALNRYWQARAAKLD